MAELYPALVQLLRSIHRHPSVEEMTTTSSRPSPSSATTLPTFTLPTSTPWSPPAPNPLNREDSWTLRTGFRNTTYPRSRYVAINARYDLYVPEIRPCNPSLVRELKTNPGTVNLISCAVPDLDAALEICSITPQCSGVADRMATSVPMAVDRETRYLVFTPNLRAEYTGTAIGRGAYYVFYYPIETPFRHMTNFGNLDYLSPPPDNVIASAIFAGTSHPFRRSDELLQGLQTAFNTLTIVALVAGLHFLLLLVLLPLYWKVNGPFKDPFVDFTPSACPPQGGPRTPPPRGWNIRAAEEGIEMRRVVGVHGNRDVKDPNLPYYTPPPPTAVSTNTPVAQVEPLPRLGEPSSGAMTRRYGDVRGAAPQLGSGDPNLPYYRSNGA
ncbi:hypothetical protein HDU96_004890 [Phlyctochytrium bullatum]|nr:hypothetical protein HDU96_004890 [Phlyctochytrium bullatum]